MIRGNTTQNGYVAVAGGYPLRLWQGGELIFEAVVPKSVLSVSAAVSTETGVADVHAGLFAIGTTVDASDGEVVIQEDIEALSTAEQTLTVDVPVSTSTVPVKPVTYVYRLWVDNITGFAADTRDRDSDSAISDEPAIATGVSVSSITFT